MDKPTPDAATTAPPLPATAGKNTRNARKIIWGVIGVLAVVIGGYYGSREIRHALRTESTNDAQIEGDIDPVLPRVSGYVTRVLIADNEHVTAGQPLIEIDPRELDLKVADATAARSSAEASLQNADAALASARAGKNVADANIVTAAVTEAKAASDLARDTKLFDTHAITDSQLTDTRAVADVARARLEAVRREAAAAGAQIAVARAQVDAARAQIDQRQSDLDFAKLQRSYATVTGPIAGIVSHKNVEPGQFVQSGQTLLVVASDTNLWVVANFKETQLTRMQIGLPVELTVDSYPGVVMQGRVDSLAGATGARFALLPPDNASGNFVKVTQRVPVKIVLTGPPDSRHVLRPGMSVDVGVRVKD